MIYIHFIINPISGNGKHIITADYLRSYFPPEAYKIEVHYTQYKGHAVELANTAVALNANCIVACGGDGTINEVASCLVHTSIILGIIPVGSGNGLASHLQIPRDSNRAMAIIKKNVARAIDAGTVNGHYFFSNTGVGIDAMIIKKYAQSNGRTLWAYIKAAVSSSIAYKPKTALLECNEGAVADKAFMLFVSNSNQMGYNMGLTRKASLNDGLLNVVIIPELSLVQKLQLGYYVMQNKAENFKPARHFLTKKLNIELPEHIFTDIQIDGEYHNLKTNRLKIALLENGLKVFCP